MKYQIDQYKQLAGFNAFLGDYEPTAAEANIYRYLLKIAANKGDFELKLSLKHKALATGFNDKSIKQMAGRLQELGIISRFDMDTTMLNLTLKNLDEEIHSFTNN